MLTLKDQAPAPGAVYINCTRRTEYGVLETRSMLSTGTYILGPWLYSVLDVILAVADWVRKMIYNLLKGRQFLNYFDI